MNSLSLTIEIDPVDDFQRTVALDEFFERNLSQCGSTFDRTECQTGHQMLLNDEGESERRNDHHHRQSAHAAPINGELGRIVEQADRQRLANRSSA